jgi:adenylosuccinate synthase
MTVAAVVGANWGDEGKGKITDCLAAESDVVVRFQGGGNAGHTINNSFGRFVLHLLPSGVFHPHTTNILGPGVALNIEMFLQELETLRARGVPEPKIFISDRAQVVLPCHLLLDRYEEERLAGEAFGSTKQGIAPFYADKCLKVGVQVSELFDAARLRRRLDQSLAAKNVLFERLYGKPAVPVEDLVAWLLEGAEKVRPFVRDTFRLLEEALREGKRVLLEGQLGALRDPDHGIYPYCTSSSPLAGFAAVGAGVPPYAIQRIVAVAKAYSSCVGAGPFVTEIFGDAAEELRRRGGDRGEYGATTGRPRRMGWFDAVATRYGCRLQGATEVALSLLDVLGYLDEIPLCAAYEIDGRRTQEFPASPDLERAKPIWERLPGWRTDVRGARAFGELPLNARNYVLCLEELIATPIRLISVGPSREEILSR